ncbi:transcription cofactor vestigial-like protein 1 isoform X3 [Sciurus carolinensis]|uniref:transcription cofactor vestigial-like protein 1 isoform X3 n=1 Tax=Sciurus carolinensis TaxID=30640 RepID=UPI001FB1FCC0|nr:transcription cofactor vestigial-like protein 1 isoform X3 [Sciurus carolinensis]
MAEMKKTDIQQPKDRQRPIKTEWNSQCVIFTYFQGDINSVVDEHFSRALSNIKRPQGLNSSSQGEDVILRNDSDMPPNQWRFSSPWTKSQPDVSHANSANNSSLNVSGPVAVDQYPLSLPEIPSTHPRELWHFPSLASPRSPEPGYSHVFPDGHLVPEPRPDGKCKKIYVSPSHGPASPSLANENVPAMMCYPHHKSKPMGPPNLGLGPPES